MVQHTTHGAGMIIGRSLVGISEIGVGVKLNHPHRAFKHAESLQSPCRKGVFASQDNRNLFPFHKVFDLLREFTQNRFRQSFAIQRGPGEDPPIRWNADPIK